MAFVIWLPGQDTLRMALRLGVESQLGSVNASCPAGLLDLDHRQRGERLHFGGRPRFKYDASEKESRAF